MKQFVATVAVLASLTAGATASGLNLSYSESGPSGGLYTYSMTLSVDNSDSTFTPGMGWSWITFGDVPTSGGSPLNDFVVTSANPWTFGNLESSQGGHNGPTWLLDNSNNIDYWTPSTASDTISWTGTSAYDAASQGPLFFSELITEGGASPDNFKMMIPVAAPEPMPLLALGGMGLVLLRRRRK